MGIKWFSGGNERKEEALSLMDDLLKDLSSHQGDPNLAQVIQKYHQELADGTGAVSLVLSRFQLEITRYLSENAVKLSDNQESLLKEIRKLSEIRYGYL
ncbi:bacteriocin immunity protein [Streptococcus sp. DD12]|uniref:bacteriocin immunity protein n=1 Tax=Streptococcus sp. DD12 TaxID=1777880 RepID=UPI0007960369|nr:bacteriocin immunity protein [Streptococcus sp. DD12]KXT75286.1 Bacteriocin prepeptide or inducing factor for bacteriocin synthesis [Streptococcus sp. DD12]